MKSVKIFIVAFLTAGIFASCEKSNVRPRCAEDTNTEKSVTVAGRSAIETPVNTSDSQVESPETGRFGRSSVLVENQAAINPSESTGRLVTEPEPENSLDVYGSGDEDRDGGDKRKKR